jgi:DNA-binding transcriptional LysR family regulator
LNHWIFYSKLGNRIKHPKTRGGMDHFKQISTFVAVATKGTMTAAAIAEGVAPAMIGRRLDALEERLGVKLLVRTTRRISLTHEGSAFLEDCNRILGELANAEAAVSAGGIKASGHVRMTAPAGFGRRHIAPLMPEFIAQHPEVTVSLELSDRLVDLLNEGFDCAVRIGDLSDSSLVAIRLAENRRMVVAAPVYIKRYGKPGTLDDLMRHRCLTLGPTGGQRGWLFQADSQLHTLKPASLLECSDGAVLHDWAIAGCGLAWRSAWEVASDIAAGRLVTVLDEFAAPPNGIYAVFPQRKHLPLRVRTLIDTLKNTFGNAAYWERASA